MAAEHTDWRSEASAGHEDIGIRLSFLRGFVAGLSLGEDPTCHDIYTYLESLCQEQQISFVEYVRQTDPNAVGEPEIFVSHPWTGKMNTLLKTIERTHPKGSDVVVFMDMFCQTLEMIIGNLKFVAFSFASSAHKLIRKIKFTAVYVPVWNEPSGLQRLWCAFEIMVTLLCNGDIVFLFPESEERKLVSDVTTDPMSFFNVLVQIDCKNATCSRPEDEVLLRQIMNTSGISNEMINAKVFRMYLENYQKAIVNSTHSITSAVSVPNANKNSKKNSKKKKQSAAYGIKLSYLKKFIERHGGEAAFQGKNIHEVNKEYNVVDTAQTKLSHCDTLLQGSDEDKSFVGESQWFVSYCWTYYFLDVVESLDLFFSKRGEDDVIVFIDMFSVNQHGGNQPFEYFKNEFGPAVGSIGRTLLVTMDIKSSGMWSPEVLHRSWCIFELWATCLYNCELHITMDSSNRAIFNNLYRSSNEFIRYLSSFKLAEAGALKEIDKSNIENVIKKTIGYDAVHGQVFAALVEAFVKELLLITPENQVEFEQREQSALRDITNKLFNNYKMDQL